MAQTLRSEIDLPTLRISVDLATSDAVFAVVRADAGPTEVARCAVEDLGLPRGGVGRVDDAARTVPEDVVTLLEQAVEGLGESPLPQHNALWLEFPVPRGPRPRAPLGASARVAGPAAVPAAVPPRAPAEAGRPRRSSRPRSGRAPGPAST